MTANRLNPYFGFYDYLWPKLSYVKQCTSMCMPSAAGALKALVNDVRQNLPGDSIYSKAVFVRNWVNENSVHLIDDEHDSYAFKLHLMVRKVRDYRFYCGSKPHLSCGPRSYLMKEILNALGVKSRVIDLFEIVNNVPQSHTLLEVYLSDEDRWVLQDPDFNAEYIRKSDGRCLSARECLEVESRKLDFNANGHLVENRENLIGTIETYFDLLVLYRYSYDGKKTLVLLNNLDVAGLNVSIKGELISLEKYLNLRVYTPRYACL